MKTLAIPGFIHTQPAGPYDSSPDVVDGLRFQFWTHKHMIDPKFTLICPYDLTFELPEGWNPTATRLAELERKRAELSKQFSMAVNEINTQISKLQALEYEAPNHV